MTAIGKRLAKRRLAAGLSGRALAASAGISANSLSRIERGHQSPTIETLERLADAMTLPIEAFLGEPTPVERLHPKLRAIVDQLVRQLLAVGPHYRSTNE